jgi:hypothetical protein
MSTKSQFHAETYVKAKIEVASVSPFWLVFELCLVDRILSLKT